MLQILGFALLCVVWGTSWVAIKFSLFGFPPFLGAALRFVLASAMLGLYLRLRRPNSNRTSGSLPLVIVTGVLVYVVDYGLIYWGEQFLSAGVTAIFFSTFPLFTGLISNFVFRSEPTRGSTYAGLAVGLTGVTVIFYDELARTAFDSAVILAALAILTGAASGAFSSVLVKKFLSTFDPASLSLRQMVIGSVALMSVGLLRGEAAQTTFDGRAVIAVVYLALAASALAFTLYYWLLQNISAITLSLVVYFTPLVAILFDWLLLGQVVTLQTLGGMSLVFLGVALSQLHHYRSYRRRLAAERLS